MAADPATAAAGGGAGGAEPLLTFVVARAANGIIGRDGQMPWRLKTDLNHFRAATMGKPVLMGRKTWASLGKALPGRANLVLTRDAGVRAPGAFVFSDLSTMLAAGRAMALRSGAGEVCVIGGATLYAALLDRADRLLITEVDAAPAGDAVFPEIDAHAFQEIARETAPAGPGDDHAVIFRTLVRALASPGSAAVRAAARRQWSP